MSYQSYDMLYWSTGYIFVIIDIQNVNILHRYICHLYHVVKLSYRWSLIKVWQTFAISRHINFIPFEFSDIKKYYKSFILCSESWSSGPSGLSICQYSIFNIRYSRICCRGTGFRPHLPSLTASF